MNNDAVGPGWPVALAGVLVLAKRCDGAGVHRDLSLFAPLPDRGDHPALAVDVGVVEREHLPDPHPGRGEQPDHRPDRRRANRRRQHARGADQRRDLTRRIDVWRDPLLAGRKQIDRRDVGIRVERREVPSEPADDPEPLSEAVRVDPCRLFGPRERELGRDPALP
ncbi:MAG: hypothetical protein WBP81_02035 [Solirubrobacteraceae bacterium]